MNFAVHSEVSIVAILLMDGFDASALLLYTISLLFILPNDVWQKPQSKIDSQVQVPYTMKRRY